jgi:hypothetical protein
MIIGFVLGASGQFYSWSVRHPSPHFRNNLIRRLIEKHRGLDDKAYIHKGAEHDWKEVALMLYPLVEDQAMSAQGIQLLRKETSAYNSISKQIRSHWGSTDDRHNAGRRRNLEADSIVND